MSDTFFTRSGSSPGTSNRKSDFLLSHDSARSTIWLLTPISDAHRFVADQIDQQSVLYFGSSIVVDQHYVEALLRGIADAGLVVSRG